MGLEVKVDRYRATCMFSVLYDMVAFSWKCDLNKVTTSSSLSLYAGESGGTTSQTKRIFREVEH